MNQFTWHDLSKRWIEVKCTVIMLENVRTYIFQLSATQFLSQYYIWIYTPYRILHLQRIINAQSFSDVRVTWNTIEHQHNKDFNIITVTINIINNR